MRWMTTVLLTTLALIAVPTPASAHATLTSSNPAQGAELAAAPQEVTLTFSNRSTQVRARSLSPVPAGPPGRWVSPP